MKPQSFPKPNQVQLHNGDPDTSSYQMFWHKNIALKYLCNFCYVRGVTLH